MNEPMILNCDKNQAKRINDLHSKGYSYKQIAATTRRGVTAVTRYHRIYKLHGAEAFTSTGKERRRDHTRKASKAVCGGVE